MATVAGDMVAMFAPDLANDYGTLWKGFAEKTVKTF
jgi:hypothetical protein